MNQKILFNLFALAAFIFTFSFQIPAQINDKKTNILTADGEYQVAQSLKLAKDSGGIDGRIELLRDARIADETIVRQAKGNAPDISEVDAKLKDSFEKTPVRAAVLRVVAADGKIVDTSALECVSAEFKAVSLYVTVRKSFQITCHYENFAPYNGVEDSFVEIHDGKIRRLEAFDSKTGEKVEMAFVNSHRVGWKLMLGVKGKSRDILSVFTGWKKSATDESDGDFLVYYRRFRFDGKRWVRYERAVEEDYWEDEEGFPANAKFPKAR